MSPFPNILGFARERSRALASMRPAAAIARDRVIAAALAVMLADGGCAAVATAQAHGGVVAVVLSCLETAAFLALPVAIIALPLAWILGREEVAGLGAHVRLGLAADRPEHASIAVLMFAALLGAGALVPGLVGAGIAEHLSPRFAIILTVAFALGWMAVAAVLVTTLVRFVAWPFLFLSRRLTWLRVSASLTMALVCIVGLKLLLPLTHAVTPAAAVAGFAFGPWLSAHLGAFRRVARTSGVALTLVTALLTPAASFALARSPTTVQLAVLYRAPYTSLVVSAAHQAVDRDHDGYSPILLGGDCDDSNPAIHPGAIDIPDNGIDENCSGEDTHAYKPPPQPVAPPYPIPLPKRSNVILIQLDASRPDHTSLAGYARPTTPQLDKFAKDATWFRNAYTPAPTTRFAMASMFTGWDVDRIPQRRGPGINFTLLPAARTLAEQLDAVGYDRMGYTISYVLQHHINQGKGFRQWTTPWPVADWETSYGKDAPMTTDAGISYIKTMPEDGTKAYLLFLHYRCTHDPYIKHPESDYGNAPVDLYDSAMQFCDTHVGRFLDAVNERADKDNTAVIIFSDHGELFGEHGLTNHGNSLYEPDVRIILVAKIPHATVRVVDDPVSLTDISPTVLELAGAARDPESSAWSLVPYAMTPNLGWPKRALFLYADIWRANVHYEARGVLDGRYKYIHDINTNVNLLFDLDHDPDELTNIADLQPALRDRLAERVDSWEAYARSNGGQVTPYPTPGAVPPPTQPWRRKAPGLP